jgi:anti-anti-sigma factor
MQVKLSTKEKFTVITPQEPILSANMAATLSEMLLGFMQKDIPHLILNFEQVKQIDANIAELIADTQQQFYEKNRSFVICCMNAGLEETFDKQALLELLNSTPTESEAWDIVQMEEIERELMGDDEKYQN